MQSWIVPFPPDETARRLLAVLGAAGIDLVLRIAHPPTSLPAEPEGILFLLSRPDWISHVRTTDPRAGLEVPLRLYLVGCGERTEILYRTARECLAPYPNPHLSEIARRIDESCVEAINRLEDPAG